jgi:hypothetical protein
LSYLKLDHGILESSLWQDRDARDLFLVALLLARLRRFAQAQREIAVRELSETGYEIPAGEYGYVEASSLAIISRAGLDREAGLAALERLAAPDPESRSSAHGGRRLVRVEGGFIVLNYARFSVKDHTAAARQQRLRDRQRSSRGTDEDAVPRVTSRVTSRDRRVTTRNVTHLDLDLDLEEEYNTHISPKKSECVDTDPIEGSEPEDGSDGTHQAPPESPTGRATTRSESGALFELFWNAYGKKVGKKAALAAWGSLSDSDRQAAVEGVARYCEGREAKYRKDPVRYLKGAHWNDEPINQASKPVCPHPEGSSEYFDWWVNWHMRNGTKLGAG